MKTDWKDDIFTRRKLRMVDNGDGTVTPEDATDYTQRGDSFGAKELNEIGTEINEVKKSVSDGKAEIAAAITLKRVATAATATFHQMAENIKKIVLGSGNAQPADVLQGKTATNDSGVEFAGTMPRIASVDPAKSVVKSGAALYARMSYGAHVDNASSGYPEVSIPQASAASAAGINGDYMLDSANYLGVQGKIQSMAGVTITPQTYAQTVWSAWKRMTGNVEIAAVPLPPASVIKKGYRYWIGGNYVDGTYVYSDVTGYYYQPPNEMVGVTGGFSSRFNGGTSSSKPEEAEFTKQPGYMEASSDVIMSNTSHGFYMGFVTNKKVDITNVRTIKFLMSGKSYYAGISNNQDDFFDSGIIGKVPASAYNGSYVDDNSPNILMVDTSMISGSYYLAISCYASYGISTGKHQNRFRIHNIQYDTMA